MSVNIVNGDTLDTDFTAICNAIRAKTGDPSTIAYTPGDTSAITAAIASIGGGGGGEYDTPNLVYGVSWTTGYVIDSNGVISENANYRYSDFIDVTQGFLALIFKNEGGGVLYGYVRVIGYDSNDTFTSALLDNSFARNNSFAQKITVPSGTVKVRISCELSTKTHINLLAQTFVDY